MVQNLKHFLEHAPVVVRVRLARVRGSAPRGAGTDMYVTPSGLFGTIGGGQLEYMAIDTARALLKSGAPSDAMDVPLGPEIGQCCGGRVEITLERMDAALRAEALALAEQGHSARPQVFIFGAGHVGRALAGFFAQLPVQPVLIDSRAEELALCTAPVKHHLTAIPEADVRAAKPGAAFIIATHDHALDYLLAVEALARADAAYVGMIGSQTKRSKFERFCLTQSPEINPAKLICPMGATISTDKRPEIIAAFVVAEVIATLTSTKALRPKEVTE